MYIIGFIFRKITHKRKRLRISTGTSKNKIKTKMRNLNFDEFYIFHTKNLLVDRRLLIFDYLVKISLK